MRLNDCSGPQVCKPYFRAMNGHGTCGCGGRMVKVRFM